MGFLYPLIGCTLMLLTFVTGAVPPNMLSTYFNTQYVKLYSSAQEKCQAGGDPNPTYIWKRDGVVLSTDANYEINANTGDIKIKSVTILSGEGTYQCFAQNSMGTALSGFWEVRLATLSGFDQMKTTSLTVNEYSYFSMPCEHQPYSMPASKLDWLIGSDDNAFPTTLEDKHRIVMDADGTLHFLFVKASDMKNNPYRCQLFNAVVSIKVLSLEKLNLNVQTVPELTSKPILKYSKSIDGTIGSTITLLCIFAGNPIPNVEWLKDGSSLPGGTSRYQIDPDDPTGRKLIILKLDVKDEGDYICRATNKYGMNEGTVKVIVTGPPQWNLERLRSTRIPVGATAKFQCDAVSYHATSSLPMWMKNGEPMIGCGVKKLWCGDGTGCYDYNKKCDSRNDCPGIPSADEQNCPALETCGEGEFSCGGGECKPAAEVIRCDGIRQCLNGGDESIRHCGCKVNTDFMCADLKNCISASQRCNKHADCADGSDEKRCAYDPEKVIENKFRFSADLKLLTIPNVKKIDTMCLQCLVYNFREYGQNPKPDIMGITFGNACLKVLDPINILTGFPVQQKVQPGDIINFTISVQTDPLEQGNLRYDWYIGGKKYPDQFPVDNWSQIIKLSMGNTHIVIDTSTLTSNDDKQFQQLMGNLSVRVYHEFDHRTISTELFTESISPHPINILTGFPDKQKVQPGDIINFTISAQTDPLEQGNLRYDWYIGGKKYPDQFPLGTWSQIIKLSMGNTHIVIDMSTLTTHDNKMFLELMGNLSVRVYHEFDQRTIFTELFTEIIFTPPPRVIAAEFNLWYIALIIGILVLFVIVALIVCYLHRNRGGNYPVDKKEHQAGHDPEQELKDSGFHDVGRVNDSYDDEKPPKDDISLPESINYDSDDMTEEYGGDVDVSIFNEDGSFILFFEHY